ncbi:cell division protein FtsZ [Sulfurovum sp. bin170]|uniref:cell division protein FtsZ n=1 Tax=Sulfurovum sp. bin170 TaxID=2695268 RepID=UPI0013E0DCA8|nr:cell division protein FtsZ [Sulfurovum sp. bin170]NEW60610.1 cell division protein FtsZ [Sulfurovum sp. bin170]
MEEFNITESHSGVHGAKIKAIGVGGGGGNMINHMISEGIGGIDLLVANTDAQALDASLAPYKIQLGMNITKGLGAGMKPDVGRAAAEESYDSIKTMLNGADLVFISAGLGGGTGTGAAPIIAQAAKEVGALTVSIVTSPFAFEGRKRKRLAKEGLDELKKESDSIIVVPNERLLSIVEKNLGMRDSFRLVDNVLAQAVGGISNVILSHGSNDINLDFADVKTVMSHRGLALMGVGESQGNSAAYDAAKTAIESPLLDNLSIDGAMGILVHFHIHPDYPLTEISEAMDIVEENADEDANIIFGTTTSEDIPIDEVKLTIIATGFDDPSDIEVQKEVSNNNQKVHIGRPELKKPVQSTLLNSVNSAKVVGGYNNSNDDYLDTPTFLRKQMD